MVIYYLSPRLQRYDDVLYVKRVQQTLAWCKEGGSLLIISYLKAETSFQLGVCSRHLEGCCFVELSVLKCDIVLVSVAVTGQMWLLST